MMHPKSNLSIHIIGKQLEAWELPDGHHQVQRRGVDFTHHGISAWMKQWMSKNSLLTV
jgi:hypothetical protein